MNFRSLLHTSVMRVALWYAALYAVLMMLGLSLIFWHSSRYVDEQIATGLRQQMQELQLIDRQHGRPALLRALTDHGKLTSGRYFLLMSATHQKIVGNFADWPSGITHYGSVANVWISHRLLSANHNDDDGYWPMIAEKLTDGGRLLLAQSLSQAEELQEQILYTIIVILLVSVGLALAMGWFIGKTVLMRIERINSTADAISSGQLSRRIPISQRHDEFDMLAAQLNAMLQRIEQLLSGMRQVSDNIAHDLRKPLSRLRNRLEITLLEARTGDEYRAVLAETISDTDDLIRTFNALLEIAQTEAGSFRGEWQTVDLSELLTDLAKLYRDVAKAQQKRLRCHVAPGLAVAGNRHLLAQSFSNLLDNAIKYTDAGCLINISAHDAATGISVQISDNGPGIPSDQTDAVLQRFTRLDSARSTPGNGLGLSLVKAVVQLHGVQLILSDNRPGLKVELCFANNHLISGT